MIVFFIYLHNASHVRWFGWLDGFPASRTASVAKAPTLGSHVEIHTREWWRVWRRTTEIGRNFYLHLVHYAININSLIYVFKND